MNIHLVLGRYLAGLMLLAGIVRAEVTVSSGFDYSTGNYGLPVSTEIVTIPFSVAYAVNRTTWELSLPYLRVDGPGDVVPGIGRYAQRLLRSKTVTRGLGDLMLGASHEFAAPDDQPWSWAAGAEVKFGTADVDKSLGTGEDDFAAHVDFTYTTGAFTPFATLGYRWLGNPPGSDLRNFFFATVGVSWTCPAQITLTVLVDWAEKNSGGGTPTSNFTVSASRAFGENWQGQVYCVLGNSDNSADYGLGLGISRRF